MNVFEAKIHSGGPYGPASALETQEPGAHRRRPPPRSMSRRWGVALEPKG